jgi:Trypsin-like peptidase domain
MAVEQKPAAPSIEGTPLTTERLRQLSREARASSAAITLVLASVGSAFAAVAGLPHWVPVVAAIAAVLSGTQVVWNELVIPMRIRSAENATHYLVSRSDDQQPWRRGTAFQIAPNRWVTAQHIIRDCNEILLRMEGGDLPARVLYQNADTDLAVLAVNNKWAWQANITRSVPDSGDRIKIIGWTHVGDGPSLRIAFDYLVQGQGEGNMIALTGPDPQLGFSGGPAIEMRSGRVVGILSKFGRGRDRGAYGPQPVTVIFLRPISDIPEEYR